MAQTTIVAH